MRKSHDLFDPARVSVDDTDRALERLGTIPLRFVEEATSERLRHRPIEGKGGGPSTPSRPSGAPSSQEGQPEVCQLGRCLLSRRDPTRGRYIERAHWRLSVDRDQRRLLAILERVLSLLLRIAPAFLVRMIRFEENPGPAAPAVSSCYLRLLIAHGEVAILVKLSITAKDLAVRCEDVAGLGGGWDLKRHWLASHGL